MDARSIASRTLETARPNPEPWIAAVKSAHETYSSFVSRTGNPLLSREFLFMEMDDSPGRYPVGFSSWVESLVVDGDRLHMLPTIAFHLRELSDAETDALAVRSTN